MIVLLYRLRDENGDKNENEGEETSQDTYDPPSQRDSLPTRPRTIAPRTMAGIFMVVRTRRHHPRHEDSYESQNEPECNTLKEHLRRPNPEYEEDEEGTS